VTGAVRTNRDVAQVGDARVAQILWNLAPQATFHLVLVEEDAVLRRGRRLDVAIEGGPGNPHWQGRGGEESRRTCSDHGYYVT